VNVRTVYAAVVKELRRYAGWARYNDPEPGFVVVHGDCPTGG
jgi:hypothetical protein